MTHYEALGVPRTAKPEEIKAAYKRLAQRHHPDRKGGDTRMFQIVQKAYDTLSDPELRKRYDETGDDRQPPSMEVRARQQLAALIFMICQKEDLDRTDIVRHAIKVCDQAVKNTEPLEEAQERIDAYAKAARRIRKRKGENVLKAMLENQIAAEKANIARIKEEIEVTKLVRSMVGEYEDAPPFANWTAHAYQR